ncbi:hypothetical protein PLICRDRAFT_119208 [Plicaturopsis crispa FD-325 SS-3]|uniref:Unplaced genomic scaffold PLICRscaffold_22, whole genome shotgun sequence n=1 Tax=Plicaturopsis crispa FD-325 SS-3 TaxID=944288 RepID=A0A0C9SKF0_PLICR|nr:hypothetical protein PLICRDRAFT_119208 [Plicaturopsis crispa FD-325 SS-3]
MAITLVALLAIRWHLSPYRKLPPGPRGVPLLGNLLQLSMQPWQLFTEWKDIYGPIISLNLVGHTVIVLNDHKVASDLLDQRSAIYSGRPRSIVGSEFLTGGLSLAFLSYGETSKRMRRSTHEALSKSGVKDYLRLQSMEAAIMTKGLLDEPAKFDAHLLRTTTSITTNIIYGADTMRRATDPAIKQISAFMARALRAAQPGAYLVELFTWMKYMPTWLAKWKRDALEHYNSDSKVFESLFDGVAEKIAKGDEQPSIVASLISQQKRHGLTKAESSWLAATFYGAGVETTAGVLVFFIQAMLHYPHVQERAQAELDAVVGRSRMPTFEDMENLPYIRAIAREALRWKPVGPGGMPHMLMEDDWYDGYFIPKGAIVLPNIWAMNRNPEVYGPDATEFRPERFLASSRSSSPVDGMSSYTYRPEDDAILAPAPRYTKEEGHVTYGYGRRICPGRFLANNSLFIDIACMLWGCSFTPLVDASGQKILPDIKNHTSDGIILRAMPFECDITPRFPEVADVIAQTEESF